VITWRRKEKQMMSEIAQTRPEIQSNLKAAKVEKSETKWNGLER
jgi:hypothetical protein